MFREPRDDGTVLLPRWLATLPTPAGWTEARLGGRAVGVVANWIDPIGPNARLMVARPLWAEADWSQLRRAVWISLTSNDERVRLAVSAGWAFRPTGRRMRSSASAGLTKREAGTARGSACR